MLKVIKTTTMTTLAALSLAAAFGTTANAQSFNNNNNDQVLGGLLGAVAGGVMALKLQEMARGQKAPSLARFSAV